MRKYISKLHYLTQDLPNRSHAEQTSLACEAGANWIQYRCLSKSDDEMIEELHQVASICDDWGATLIITSHYHLLDKVDAQGVHLENLDADYQKIRSLITDEKTLGASANCIDDIRLICATNSVDYIGCGPFRTTHTKPNDSPLLGLQGYQHIIKEMQHLQLNIPILAVGGITEDDVQAVMQTGVNGIAVSGAVNLSANPVETLKNFYRQIY